MKLDEYSINLKEEAEIKGGGLPKWIDTGLPKGFSKAKPHEVQDINTKIPPGAKINDDTPLIKISKKSSSFRKIDIPEFDKIDKLFGNEKTGKSLHFLKASFFKTDENTIYTYSEHRPPMLLVEDFSEYYENELERDIVLGVNSELSESDTKKNIKAFVTLINIIYLLCKKIESYLSGENRADIKARDNKELSFVSHIIALLEGAENGSLKDIFITGSYNGESYDLEEGVTIGDDKDIFDIISLSKTKNISLKFIIIKLYVLSTYLNKIIVNESAIKIFKPELYNIRFEKDRNYDNYLYLYNAIINNLNLIVPSQTKEVFNQRIKEIKDASPDSDINENLTVLAETIIEVLRNFNDNISKLNATLSGILTKNASTIKEVLEHLQSKIDKVDKDNKPKDESENEKEVDETIQGFTTSATQDENTLNEKERKIKMVAGIKGEIEELKSNFNKDFEAFKQKYETNYKLSQTKKTEIESIIYDARQLLDGDGRITDTQYTNMMEQLNSLKTTTIAAYKSVVDSVNEEATKANTLITNTKTTFGDLNYKLATNSASSVGDFIDIVGILAEINAGDESYIDTTSDLITKIEKKYDTHINKQALNKEIESLLTENTVKQEQFKRDHASKEEEIQAVVKDIDQNIVDINAKISENENADFGVGDKLVKELQTNITKYKKLLEEAKEIFIEAQKEHEKDINHLKSLNDRLQETHKVPDESLEKIGPLSITNINEDYKPEKYNKELTKISNQLKSKNFENAQKIIEQVRQGSATKIQAMAKGVAARGGPKKKKSDQQVGGNNTKELRQKLNTMSIKQLKRLSDKKHIEYGNKNTIKSLINNYMKHI
jgi:hypothetical protein